jgi:hypothetical protein
VTREPAAAPVVEGAFDEALDIDLERVDALVRSAEKYVKAVRAWKKACQSGNVDARQKAAAQARDLVPGLGDATIEAADAWTFDVTAWLEGDAWIRDLKAAAAKSGLRTIVDGDTLVVPPVVVSSSRRALKIGLKRAWPSLRPRVVVEELKRLRDRRTAAGAQEFLECLYGAWQHLSSADLPVARFRDIYALFALTPGWKKENSEMAFGQAVYALQRSDVRTTRKGAFFTIEYATGNVREKDIFTVYAEDGSPRRYYGIRFRKAKA